jgi:hypothetical protein
MSMILRIKVGTCNQEKQYSLKARKHDNFHYLLRQDTLLGTREAHELLPFPGFFFSLVALGWLLGIVSIRGNTIHYITLHLTSPTNKP